MGLRFIENTSINKAILNMSANGFNIQITKCMVIYFGVNPGDRIGFIADMWNPKQFYLVINPVNPVMYLYTIGKIKNRDWVEYKIGAKSFNNCIREVYGISGNFRIYIRKNVFELIGGVKYYPVTIQ